MAENAKWYVVHTYAGYENKVASTIEKTVENRKLHDLIHATYIPMETVVEIKDGERREVERMIFPSYVLVKMVMTDESWYVIRNTRGVTGFVGPESKPVPLTEEELNALGVEKHEVTVDYAVGDSIKIIEGAFENIIGKVEEIDIENSKVKVTVLMFGRETTVDVDLAAVEPVEE